MIGRLFRVPVTRAGKSRLQLNGPPTNASYTDYTKAKTRKRLESGDGQPAAIYRV